MSDERVKLDLEALLSDALRPIEPPEDLVDPGGDHPDRDHRAGRAELSSWAEELSESELESLRDPRNWVRPVAAVAAGTLAGGALVVVGMRRRRRSTGLRADGRERDALGAPRARAGGRLLRRAPSGAARAAWRGLAAPAASRQPDDQLHHVVRGVHRHDARIESPPPMMKPQIATTR